MIQFIVAFKYLFSKYAIINKIELSEHSNSLSD